MARFTYRATDKDGDEHRGAFAAISDEAALERLRSAGLFVSDLRRERLSGLSLNLEELPLFQAAWGAVTRGRVPGRHRTLFTRQLAALIGAGVPLRRAVGILGNQTASGNLRRALEAVGADLDEGIPLHQALAAHPRAFPPVYVDLVRAGEESGKLEDVLRRVAFDMERRQSLQGKVRSALVYPGFVLTVAVTILTLVLLFIVPRFEEIYRQIDKPLPVITQLLVEASRLLLHHTPVVMAGAILLALALPFIRRFRRGRLFLDGLSLRIPVFGVLLQKAAVGRFSRMLATCFDSGVPILDALRLVAGSSGNERIRDAVGRIAADVREGEDLSASMAREPVFPPLVSQMLAIGEETGELDQMLNRCAEIYEEDVDVTVKGLSSVLEPVLIVVLGAFIGFVVIALYMPIFVMVGTGF